MLYKKIKNIILNIIKLITNISNPLRVTVLIGAEGTLLCAYYKNKLQEILLTDNPDVENFSNIKALDEFITKYKKATLYILLDNAEASIKHTDLTMLSSFIPKDVIHNYTLKEFDQNHLYSYLVLSVERSSSEIMQAIFAVTPLNPAISFWIDEIYSRKNFKFGNIYFLPLEASNVIYNFTKSYIDESKQKELLQADIQILLFISKVSGIRIIAEQNRNILLNTIIQHPEEKSVHYIQGIIEHELSEILLSLKHIVGYDEDTVINLTIITNTEIAELLQNQKFETNSQIIIASNDLIAKKFDNLNIGELANFSDIIISDLMMQHKTYPATNSNLRTLINFSSFNSLGFKPLILGLLILIINNSYIKYAAVRNENKLTNTSREYFKYSAEYRKLKAYHSNIEHLDQVLDVVLLDEKLQQPEAAPFELLNKFKATQSDKILIEKIKWTRQTSSNGVGFLVELEIKYTIDSLTNDKYFIELSKYINELREKLKPYKIEYSRMNGKIKTKADKISIPLRIIIMS